MQTAGQQIIKRVDCSDFANPTTKLEEAIKQINEEGYIVTQAIPTLFYESGRPYEFALLCTLAV